MTLPWYPFFWGDYSSKTMHLTQGQHGAYILFLRWIYTTGTPIPHKQRFSIAKAMLDLEHSDATAVLEQFFSKKGASWHSRKAEEVIKTAGEKHQKYVEAGRLGGQKKSSDAKATLEPSSSNHTHNQKVVNLNGFSVGRKNGESTIKDPQERLNRFQKTLAEAIGRDGYQIVGAAADPENPLHSRSLALCQAKAKELGKGWPPQWPV